MTASERLKKLRENGGRIGTSENPTAFQRLENTRAEKYVNRYNDMVEALDKAEEDLRLANNRVNTNASAIRKFAAEAGNDPYAKNAYTGAVINTRRAAENARDKTDEYYRAASRFDPSARETRQRAVEQYNDYIDSLKKAEPVRDSRAGSDNHDVLHGVFADTQVRSKPDYRTAAAFTPTSDMYLNPATAQTAKDMQSIADKAMERTTTNTNPATDAYLKKRQGEIITQIKVVDKKREAARFYADKATKAARARTSGLANPNAQAAAQAELDAAYAPLKELDNQRAALMDELHKVGGAYGAADTARAVHGAVWRGMSNFEDATYRGLDFLNRLGHYALGWSKEDYDNANTLTSQLVKHGQQNVENWDKYTRTHQGSSKAAEIGTNVLSGTVAALPYSLMAIMSGGASLAGETTAGLAAAANAASATTKVASLANSARTAVTSMVQDPQYWFTVLQVIGESYDQAKADGASEDRAVLYAIINSLSNAVVEIGGGGIQELIPENLRKGGVSAVRQWVDSMIDEGKEEVVQGIMERGLQILYGKRNELGEIINPATALQEFGMGAAVGGLLGSGQVLASAQINRRANQVLNSMVEAGQQGRTFDDAARTLNVEKLGIDENILRQAHDVGVKQLTNMAERLGIDTDDKSLTTVSREVDERTKQIQNMTEEDLAKADQSEKDLLNIASYTMGENGRQLMRKYSGRVDTVNNAELYNEAYAAYEMGRNGAENTFKGEILTEKDAARWYNAGKSDAAVETQRSTGSTRANTEGVAQNGEQNLTGQSSNAGEGRSNGLAPDGQSQPVAGEPGGQLAREAAARGSNGTAADAAVPERQVKIRQQQAAAEKLADGKQLTSSTEQGISNGTAFKTFRVLDDNQETHTDAMKRVDAEAAELGVKVKWYTGRMFLDDGKGPFSVRGLHIGGGGTIWIRADANADIESISLHELFHEMEEKDPTLHARIREKIAQEAGGTEQLYALFLKYAEEYDGLSDDQIYSEIFADANGSIDIFEEKGISLKPGGTPEENVRALQFREAVRSAVAESKPGQQPQNQGVQASRENAEAKEDVPDSIEKTLDKYNAAVRDGVVVADSIARIMDSPEYHQPVSVSDLADMASHDTLPEWAEKYINGGGSKEALDSIQRFDDMIWKSITGDYTDVQKLLQALVPSGHVITDKFGPLRTNVEYRRSFDMDTSCPRTFQFVAYRNAIMKRLNRTLTFDESINLLNLMSAYHQMIPCTYCYVENKRILKAGYYNNFYNFHNTVLNAVNDGLAIEDIRPLMYGWDEKHGKLTDAAEKVLGQWMDDKSGYNPTIAENYHTVNVIRNAAMHLLDGMKDAGKIKANTSVNSLANIIAKEYNIKSKGAMSEVTKMAEDWRYDAGRNAEHVYLVEDLGEEVNKSIADRALELDNEAIRYANSASKAKTVDNYAPYGGELENISEADRNYILGMGGIRKHSSNDFRIDYVLDYFQFFADLAKGKWTGHTYTKNADYVRIFGRTGDMINMSIAFNDAADGVTENLAEGMEHKLAKELRKAFPNAGVMAMVTSDKQLSYALNADWVDMIIPFHNSGLPKAIWYNMKAWADYTSVQSETLYNGDEMKEALKSRGVDTKGMKAAEIQDAFYETFGLKKAISTETGKMFAPHFFPYETVQNGVTVPGHSNSKSKYMELCREYGVHPRFDGVTVTDAGGNEINIVDHPNYMKVVKETSRATENFTQPTIEFSFNKADPYLTEKYGKQLGKKSVTPMDYAMDRLLQEAKNGGYQNAADDQFGIVDEFIREYAGKGRPLGWLSDRAEVTKEDLDSAQDKLVDATRAATLEEFKKTEGVKEKPKVRSNFYADMGNDGTQKSAVITNMASREVEKLPAGTVPATRSESLTMDATDDRNVLRYRNEISSVLDGTMPSNQIVLIGSPSAILAKYLKSENPLYMSQASVKHIVLPKTEKGGKHGFGRAVLDQIVYQFEDPMAITGNTTKHVEAGDNSIIVWTDWKNADGDSIIIPIRIDVDGSIGIYNNVNTVFNAWDESYVDDILRDGNVLYTRDGKSISDLLAQRRDMPKWKTDDALSENDDTTFSEKVNSDMASRETDNAYMKAIESGDMETAQRMVDETAKAAGAYTDKSGNPIELYHGSNSKHSTFTPEKMGDGSYGIGYYFAIDNDTAKHFGSNIVGAYLLSKRVASDKTHFITADSIVTLREKYGLSKGNMDALKSYVNAHNDSDLMHGIMRWSTNKDRAYSDVMRDYKNILGIDAMLWSEPGYVTVYDGSLIKSADPVTYDDNGNVIPLSERFNSGNNDIRYSRESVRENLNDDYTRPTDKVELTDKQLKNRKKTIDNDVVGSALYTLAGQKIERYGGVVGKALDNTKLKSKQVYVHKSAVDASVVPNDLYRAAQKILEDQYPDFKYNAVMYDTGKPGVLRFDEAKDFDTEREPTVGYQVTVDTNTGTAKMSKSPSPTIWHHKWLWVTDDYTGFDQETAWRWSQKWLSTITKMDKATDLKYGGFTYNGVANGSHIAAWNEQLDQFGLEHDENVQKNMASMDTDAMDRIADLQGPSSEDTSIPQVATTFTHFIFNPTDRILDYGGGQYNIAQRAMQKVYGKGMKFEIVDLFNRSKAHNLKVFSDFEKNKADAITINNVLNVIDTYEARQAVLDTASRYIKHGGLVYLCFYEGNGDDSGSGIGGVTKVNKGNESRSSYQTKMPTEAYMDEVLQVFPYAKLVGGNRFIIASDHEVSADEYVYDAGIKSETTRALKDFNDQVKQNKDYVSYRYGEMTPEEIDEKYLEATEINPKTGKRDESAIKGIVEHVARREGLSDADAKKLLKVQTDSDGNVIPISQRVEMTPENFTAYSREVDTRLQEENIDLQRRLDAALADTKLTRGWRAAQKDVTRVAADIIDATSSKESKAIVEQKIRSLVEAASNGGIDSAEMKDLALDIARGLLKRSSVLTSKDATTYDAMRDYLKSVYINVPAEMRKQFTDWKAFADAHKAMRMKTTGVGIGTVYAELQKRMGEDYFPPLTEDMDKLQQIAEILDNLTPVYDNPYSVNMAEATEETANAILESILDIGQAEPTFADRAKARENDVRSQYQQKLAEQKEYLQGRIQQEADKRKDQTEAIKQYYQEMRENQRTRKQESADRQKLLRVAKRLQNRKMTAVNRAMINQLIGDLDTVSVNLTNKSLTNLRELADWYDGYKDDPNFLHDKRIEDKLSRLGKRHIGDMTIEDVRDLTDVLRNIENSLANYGKMVRTEDRRLVSEMSTQAQEDIRNTKGSKKHIADWLVTNTLAPERLIRRLTGYNENDPLYQRTKELSEGQRKMFDYQRRAEALFSKWTNNRGLMEKLRNKDTVKIRGIVDGKDTTIEITPDMRMALYLHSLNDQNLKHIMNGGITIPDVALYRKGDIADAYAAGVTAKLSPDMVRGVANGMTAEERAFANAAHKYFNGMSREEINAVSEALLGYSLANVEDYFPIQTDDAFTQKEIDAIQNDGSIQGMGFTKEREDASNAIYLVPMTDVLKRSIQNHAKYVGMAIPVANMNKLWMANTKDGETDTTSGLKSVMRGKWGDRANKAVEKILTDVQNPHVETDEFGKALAKVRSNYAGAVLSLNGGVALKQAASYPTAAAVLGWGPVLKAMGKVGRVDLDTINKYTPLQWYRSQGYSTQEIGDIKSQQGLMSKVLGAHITTKSGREVPLLNWIQGIDLLTTRKLWKASEIYVRENDKTLKVGSDDYYKTVADIYNRVIEETQPNYTTMQRPQLLRTSNELARTLVMFKTQPFQNFNILYDAIGELRAAERLAKNGDKSKLSQAKKNAVNAITSNIVSAAVFAAMTMAWSLARRKWEKYEDEEGNFNPWKQIGKDVLSSEFGMLPFGSDAYELLASWAFGDKYYGMSNITADSLSGALDSTKKAFDEIGGVLKAWLDGDPDTKVNPEQLARKLFNAAQDASKLLGVPLDNVLNLVTAVYANVAEGIKGEYVTAYEILKLTKGFSSSTNMGKAYDLLWRAYKTGDETYNDLLKIMVEDFGEDKIKNAMESRMKKDQGVRKVEELDQRWMMPTSQGTYDDVMRGVEGSNLYAMANVDQLAALESAMYDYAMGNDDGKKIAEKISGGASVGLDESEYFEYVLALKIADTPNKSGKLGGAPTNEEAENAIRMVDGLTDAERSYLWGLTQNEKSDPFQATKSTTKTAAKTTKTDTKSTTKAEPKQETKPKTDAADVSNSSAITKATYDPATQTAYITYKSSGKTYTYEGITQDEWERFKNASSKGPYVRNWQ